MNALLSSALVAIIRERREAAGLGRNELSRKAGLSETLIGHLELVPRSVTVTTLAGIAEALGMRGSQLLALAEERAADERRAA